MTDTARLGETAGGAELEKLATELDRCGNDPLRAVRVAALHRLRDKLAAMGICSWLQPGGETIGIKPGLYAGVSRDGKRYGWTIPDLPGGRATHPVSELEGAARRIADRHDVLLNGWQR